MTLTGSMPTEDATGLSIDDWRLIQTGMVAKFESGAPRVGVLPAHTDPIVTGTGAMEYSIAEFHAVTSRTGVGVEHVANDGPSTVATTAAPASNSRIDVIWVRSRFDMYTDSGEYTPEFGVTQGVSSLTPTKPSIPAGALELATAVVTSSDVATSTTVISQTHPYTSAEGGIVPVRNNTELQAWTPRDGSFAVRLDDNWLFQRVGGVWVLMSGKSPRVRLIKTVDTSTSPTPDTYLNVEFDSETYDVGGMHDSGLPERAVAPVSGYYRVAAQTRVNTTGSANLRIVVNSTVIEGSLMSVAGQPSAVFVSISDELYLNAGDYVRIQVASNVGSQLIPANFSRMVVAYAGA
ncbi:hypothetical protein ACIGCK_04740 [Microbacterium sp. NPDC078428]|uniref:hypothetical protein n=1 Tax=Microbacterium sp. NPDC078428 TaxID=3364190 RepID=UPI0037CA18DE